MGDTKADTVDAAHQVIVLAFDLVDAEVAQLPNQLFNALGSPAVQASIKKTLLDFANSRGASGSTVVSSADTKKLSGIAGHWCPGRRQQGPARTDQEVA